MQVLTGSSVEQLRYVDSNQHGNHYISYPYSLPPSTHTTPWPHFIIDVVLVQRGYSIPSPVLLKCCVASVIAQSIVPYRTCTGQPAVWGFVSLGLTLCDRVFLFSVVHL